MSIKCIGINPPITSFTKSITHPHPHPIPSLSNIPARLPTLLVPQITQRNQTHGDGKEDELDDLVGHALLAVALELAPGIFIGDVFALEDAVKRRAIFFCFALVEQAVLEHLFGVFFGGAGDALEADCPGLEVVLVLLVMGERVREGECEREREKGWVRESARERVK